MKNLLYFLVIFTISFQLNSFSQDIKSESKLNIGITGGYNYIIDAANMKNNVKIIDCQCPTFSNGYGHGYYAGFVMQYDLDKIQKIAAKITYNQLPSNFSMESDLYPTLMEDPNKPGHNISIMANTKQTLDVTYSLVNLDILYKIILFETNLGLSFGPSFYLNAKDHILQKYSLVSPLDAHFTRSSKAINAGYRYEDNDRTIVIIDGNIPNMNEFRFGLNFGIEYNIDFGNLTCIPSINYNQAITKVTSNDIWYLNYFQAGISIMYSI